MDFLYFIIGILVGILMSVLNILAYKKEVQQKIKRMTSKKAVIVDMEEPFSELDLTQ